MIVDSAVRMTTSTTAKRVASDMTRLNSTYSRMPLTLDSGPTISVIISSTEVKTCNASSVPHTTAAATTIITPIATDSRKDSFMTDHGSTRETARRTRRGPASGAAGAAAVVAAAGAVAPAAPAAAPSRVGLNGDPPTLPFTSEGVSAEVEPPTVRTPPGAVGAPTEAGERS